nr:unnamed protein product [Naegleria fowleri]
MGGEPEVIDYDANKHSSTTTITQIQSNDFKFETVRNETICRYCSTNFEIATLDKLCMFVRPYDNPCLKKILAQAYHDAIGSSKGEAIEHSQIITNVKLHYGPSVPKHTDRKHNVFELEMLETIANKNNSEISQWVDLSTNKYLQSVDDTLKYFEITNLPSAQDIERWKHKFHIGYRAWNCYWSSKYLSDMSVSISKDDKHFLTSLKKRISSLSKSILTNADFNGTTSSWNMRKEKIY